MKVAIIMGSISDRDVMERAKNILDKFGIETHCEVISAHRTPDRAIEFASSARENGIDAIIAIAGKAAHLAGVVAAITTVPVIGVPGKTSVMGGLDSLFSVVQMPKGIPVATVAIDGGENAAILAAQMIALSDEKLAQKLKEYKEEMKQAVIDSDKELEEI